MANKIKLARGTKSRIESIKSGMLDYELVYSTDTNELGVKKPDGNVKYIGSGSGGGLTPEQEAKLDLIKSNGDGTKYLADNGVYKAVSGGGGGVDLDTLPYMNYAANIYYQGRSQTLFSNGWTDHAKKTVYFDGDITFMATDSSLGFPLSFYTGAGIEELYNLMESGGIAAQEAVKLTIDGVIYDATSLDSITNLGVALRYAGNIMGGLYVIFGQEDNPFMIVTNTTDLGMSLGKALAFIDNESIKNLKIESGFNHYYENGVIIPDGVEVVPYGALSANSVFDPIREDFLKNANIPLVIPNSVTSIGKEAFSDWTSNNQPLIIPNSVTSIGDYAFSGWSSNNQSLIIPNSVTSIGESAFQDWKANNQPLTIPNSVTSIGENAFYKWEKNNQPLTIPNSVTSIGRFAFYRWQTNNQPLVIPNSVTSIGYGAFEDWSKNNQPLILPNSVTSIEGWAFDNWEVNNQPLVIPNSVTSIGDMAFYNWNNVPYVEMKSETPPTLANANAFDSQGNAPIYVPDGSVDDYKNATNWVSLADRIFSINDKL